MRIKSTLLIIVSFIAVALLVFTTSVQAQTDPPETQNQEPRTLSVNGSGIITLEPDIAHIHIGVQTEGENAQEAVASNNQQSQQYGNDLGEQDPGEQGFHGPILHRGDGMVQVSG